MVTAMRRSRIMMPHIVPVMIISMSEPDPETRVGSEVLPMVTEAVELENSLPVAPSGKVVLSTRDSPAVK